MILGVLTATVKHERAGVFHDLMRQQLPILREHEGLVWVKRARWIQGSTEEVVLVEEWRDTASLYGWTGPALGRARLLPGAEEPVDDLRIAHY